MTLSVNLNNSNLAFRGSIKKTENGTPYHHTTAGTTIGAVLAVPAGLIWLSAKSDNKFLDSIEKIFKNAGVSEKEIENAFKPIKDIDAYQKKYAIPFAILAAGLTLGCGMFVDYMRNKKAKEVAEYTRQYGVKNAVMYGNNAEITRRGGTYYDSNVGSKYGALLGAGCGVVSHIMASGKRTNVIGAAVGAATFALGGWLVGMLTDYNSNKAAKKA